MPRGRLSRAKELLRRRYGGFHAINFIGNVPNYNSSKYEARLDHDEGPVITVTVDPRQSKLIDSRNGQEVVVDGMSL